MVTQLLFFSGMDVPWWMGETMPVLTFIPTDSGMYAKS